MVAALPNPDEQRPAINSLLHSKIPDLRRSRSSRRIKAYWENIKICNVGVQYINSIPAGQKDPRPFLPVQVFNRTVYGLLDSGASISCVGGRLAEEIKASGNYKKIKGHATTADGRSQQK